MTWLADYAPRLSVLTADAAVFCFLDAGTPGCDFAPAEAVRLAMLPSDELSAEMN